MKAELFRKLFPCAMAGVLLVGAGCASTKRSPAELAGLPPEHREAATLFDKNCAKCHGRDGVKRTFRGKMMGAQNLTDPKWQAEATVATIASAIRKGPGAMPSFEKKLSATEIAALAAYVRTFPPH